jgi:hypothetical protein
VTQAAAIATATANDAAAIRPMEFGNNAFPDITVSFDSDEDNADKVGYVCGAGEAKAQEDNVIFVGETTALTDITATQVNTLP